MIKKYGMRVFLGVIFFGMSFPWRIDPDMWWHLKTGQWILLQGIPFADPFSFTFLGQPWITHEWLSEVLMWNAFLLGKLPGLIGVFAVMGGMTFGLVYERCEGKPFLAALVTILACSASAFLWGPRPQMFNALFFALLLLILEKVRARRANEKLLYVLPPFFLIWANLHSAFLLGIVVMLIYAGGDWLQRAGGGGAHDIFEIGVLKRFAVVIILCAVFSMINPSGYKLLAYPFETLGSTPMQTRIMEWQSPNFHLPEQWPFLILIGLLFLGMLAAKPPLTISEGLLVLGSLGASLFSLRHIPFFAILAAPIITRNLIGCKPASRIFESAFFKKNFEIRIFFKWILIAGMVVFATSFTTRVVREKVAQYSLSIIEDYPVQAVNFMKKSGLNQKRGLNLYAWGGYLIWNGVPVFVDGRADLYGDTFLSDYLAFDDAEPHVEELLEKYKVDYVLFPVWHRLVYDLTRNSRWKTVYSDETAIVLSRESSDHPSFK